MKKICIFVLLCACSTYQVSKEEILTNGSPLKWVKDSNLPRQSLNIVIEGLPNEVPFQQQALLGIFSSILDKGPKGMTEEDYHERLFLMNADVSYSSQYRAFTIGITANPKYFDAAIDLVLRTIAEPKLDNQNIKQVLREARADTTAAFSRMSSVIMYYAFKDYFDFADFTKNGSTSPSNIKKISYKDVKEAYSKYLKFKHLRFYSIGPMSQQDVIRLINSKQKLVSTKFSPYLFKAKSTNKLKTNKVTIIHRKNVTDHQVLFIYPFQLNPVDKDGIAAQVLFEIFGGGLTGRLGMTLREKRGLTYHASASYGSFLPVWYMYSFAGSQQISPLLKGALEVKNNFIKENLTTNELKTAKQSLQTDYKRSTELPLQRLAQETYYDLMRFDHDYFYSYLNFLKNTDLEDIHSIKPKIFSNDMNFHLYLMGDKTVLLPALRKIGLDKEIEVINENKI